MDAVGSCTEQCVLRNVTGEQRGMKYNVKTVERNEAEHNVIKLMV